MRSRAVKEKQENMVFNMWGAEVWAANWLLTLVWLLLKFWYVISKGRALIRRNPVQSFMLFLCVQPFAAASERWITSGWRNAPPLPFLNFNSASNPQISYLLVFICQRSKNGGIESDICKESGDIRDDRFCAHTELTRHKCKNVQRSGPFCSQLFQRNEKKLVADACFARRCKGDGPTQKLRF